jgi:hypothetical protein
MSTKSSDEKIIKWNYNSYYVNLEMIAICTDDDIKQLTEIGDIYLGEMAGKHSEVCVTVNEEDFEILTSNTNDIDMVKRIFKVNGKLVSGICLWDYIEKK